LEEISADDREHAQILRVLGGPESPRTALDLILKKERHVTGAGWVTDAIYGINDGLGAVFGIVSGMAGYTGGSEIVLITGLAGTLASALSMGSSAYLAAKSQREVYQGEIAREKAEIEHNPEEEREELELFYQLKGFTEDESRTLVARIREQPEDAGPGRVGVIGDDVSQPLEGVPVSDRIHGGRRPHPRHSVLLHARGARRRVGGRPEHPGPLRCGNRQEPRDHAPVVDQRAGDDHGRRDRRGAHLWSGAGVRHPLTGC
jgi:VIT family